MSNPIEKAATNVEQPDLKPCSQRFPEDPKCLIAVFYACLLRLRVSCCVLEMWAPPVSDAGGTSQEHANLSIRSHIHTQPRKLRQLRSSYKSTHADGSGSNKQPSPKHPVRFFFVTCAKRILQPKTRKRENREDREDRENHENGKKHENHENGKNAKTAKAAKHAKTAKTANTRNPRKR